MIDIFITILIVYIIYYFVSVRRFDKYGHVRCKNSVNSNEKASKKVTCESNSDKVNDYMALPSEVKYFIKKYNVDLEKVNLRGVLKMIGFILGIDIAIVSLLVLIIFKNVVLQIVVASVLIIPLYLISIKLLSKNFKKRGLIKNV